MRCLYNAILEISMSETVNLVRETGKGKTSLKGQNINDDMSGFRITGFIIN